MEARRVPWYLEVVGGLLFVVVMVAVVAPVMLLKTAASVWRRIQREL